MPLIRLFRWRLFILGFALQQNTSADLLNVGKGLFTTQYTGGGPSKAFSRDDQSNHLVVVGSSLLSDALASFGGVVLLIIGGIVSGSFVGLCGLVYDVGRGGGCACEVFEHGSLVQNGDDGDMLLCTFERVLGDTLVGSLKEEKQGFEGVHLIGRAASVVGGDGPGKGEGVGVVLEDDVRRVCELCDETAACVDEGDGFLGDGELAQEAEGIVPG